MLVCDLRFVWLLLGTCVSGCVAGVFLFVWLLAFSGLFTGFSSYWLLWCLCVIYVGAVIVLGLFVFCVGWFTTLFTFRLWVLCLRPWVCYCVYCTLLLLGFDCLCWCAVWFACFVYCWCFDSVVVLYTSLLATVYVGWLIIAGLIVFCVCLLY